MTTLNDVFEVLRAYCRDNCDGAQPVRLAVKLNTGESLKHPIGQAMPQPASPTPATQNSHSPDFRSVRWHGVNYTFTVKQAAVVQALWEAFDDGLPEVSRTILLQRAESDCERLRDVFRDHAAWGTLIVHGTQRDTYRLNGDEE